MEKYNINDEDKLSPRMVTDFGGEPLEEYFSCSICTKIIVDPMECKRCENAFCANCINEWKKKRNECPFQCVLNL
jgi:hypothetical protein